MSVVGGIRSTLVTSTIVYSVTTHGGTILSQGDTDSGYEVQFRHDNGGCGNPDSGILVLLGNSVKWNRIAFEWTGTGTASCWSFMRTGASNFGSSTGLGDGNLLAYSEAAGDVISRPYLTWEVPAYQSHDRIYACDNNANNFFRFNSGEAKSFFMKRRRATAFNGNFAGIHHGRSCNSTGAGAVTTIKNIRIWYED